MSESLATQIMRWRFNSHPAYRGTGAWVTYIAADWREIHVTLPLNWQTRNIVGTIFGGSIYAAVDPFYMIMLMRNLGSGCVVWDKAASVRFLKPGTGSLNAVFTLDEAELDAIHQALADQLRIDRTYQIELKDKTGEVRARVEKIIYIAKKSDQ